MKTNPFWLGTCALLLMTGTALADAALPTDSALPLPIPGVAALLAIGLGAFYLVRRNK